MTDINSIGVLEDVVRIPLFHPATSEALFDDEGEEMFIEVHGRDSAVMRKIEHDILNRNIVKAQRGSRRSLGMTAEQLEAQNLDRLAQSVISWNLVVNGVKPGCSASEVKELFTTYPWIKEQVEDGIANQANFTPTP